MTTPKVERTSSRIVVLEAIMSLHEADVEVTAEAIIRHTGLKYVTVADCIKELKEREEIWSLERGVYRLKVNHKPARACSVSPLPDGSVVVEVGDQCVILTPREIDLVSPYFAGVNQRAAAAAYNHTVMMLHERMTKAERKAKALEAMITKVVNRQPDQLAIEMEEKDPRQLTIEV